MITLNHYPKNAYRIKPVIEWEPYKLKLFPKRINGKWYWPGDTVYRYRWFGPGGGHYEYGDEFDILKDHK